MPAAVAWPLRPTRIRPAWLYQARTYPLALLALTCVGFALRLQLLHAFPLREDEAIYGYWARVATTDPFFLHVWPDKPPLFIWILTGAFALLGPGEAAARLVSIFASTLTIPLVAAGAQRLWQSRMAAAAAALLFTLNPFSVSFAPTAYTDSLLVCLGVAALVLALQGRALGAGMLVAAACMTKQQGVFYVPLVIGLLVTAKRAGTDVRVSWRERGAKVAWLLLGMALVVLPILWWDSQRWAVAPSPWDLAQRTYAPLNWLPLQQWPARWDAWAKVLWYLGGSWTVWAMVIGAIAGAAFIVWRRVELILVFGWGVAFFTLHLVTSVEVWDRYLLPLAPWLAWIVSGALLALWRLRMADWLRGLLFLLMVMGAAEFAYPAVTAAHGQLPIGADHGDYAGLTEAIAWVEQQNGPAILYHQVLGWHFRFYLYDETQPVGDRPPRFDLRWFPSAAYLADNAVKSPFPPKYLIAPDWATPPDLALHLAMRGLALVERLHVGRFAVLEIVQPPRPLCDWCKSTAPAASIPQAGPPFPIYRDPLPIASPMSLLSKP
jgi:4-amino-4-deoxy-L-arabinose transferase-like glycosyltransferase